MAKVLFDKDAYRGYSLDEIKRGLLERGYRSLLSKELPDSTLEPHRHNQSHILIQIEGDMVVESGGKKYHLAPGDKITIPPNVKHSAHSGPSGSEYLWVEY